jgi:hypothetical protein
MAEARPTPAQVRALEAIRDRQVSWHYPPWQSNADATGRYLCPAGVRADTVQRVIDMGWARPGVHSLVARPSLTPSGEAVLAPALPNRGQEA